MIEDPPLLTIRREFNRPLPTVCEAFRALPSSVIADAMNARGCLATPIGPLRPGQERIAGPALTAGCAPGDILALLAALGSVQAGDIVVSAFGGHQGSANAGDRVCGMIANSGGIGLVTDGPVRDLAGIVDTGLPVWCTGLTPASPFTTGPGTVGLPIDVGGQRVASGDMIVADDDGVVVVPQSEIESVLARAQDIMTLENDLDAAVRDGLRIPAPIKDMLASDKIKFVP